MLEMINEMKAKLSTSSDIFEQVLGDYVHKIYKEAKRFSGKKFGEDERIYDYTLSAIAAALKEKKKIRVDILKDKVSLKRVFLKFVLPMCYKAIQEEKNIFLPLTLPFSFSLRYMREKAEKAGQTLEERIAENYPQNSGCFSIDEQHNRRAFYTLRQSFLQGKFSETYNDSYDGCPQGEGEGEMRIVNVPIHNDFFGVQYMHLSYYPTFEIKELVSKLNKVEQFVIISLFFDNLTQRELADIYSKMYHTSVENAAERVTTILNRALSKMKGLLDEARN